MMGATKSTNQGSPKTDTVPSQRSSIPGKKKQPQPSQMKLDSRKQSLGPGTTKIRVNKEEIFKRLEDFTANCALN